MRIVCICGNSHYLCFVLNYSPFNQSVFMKKYFIYLVTRVFHDFNHPKTETTPADELNIYFSDSETFQSEMRDKADNVDVEILREIEHEQSNETSAWDLAEAWYHKWDDPRKEQANQHIFSDDGGDGNPDNHDLTDNELYGNTIG